MNNQSIFTQEKLLELYEKIPQNVREAIFSVDVAGKISAAGKRFGLSIEETGILATTAGLVMLGALHPRDFIQTLEKGLKMERSKAIDIAKEINHEIFFPIRESLKRIHGMETTEEVTGEKQMERGDNIQRAKTQPSPVVGPLPTRISDIIPKNVGLVTPPPQKPPLSAGPSRIPQQSEQKGELRTGPQGGASARVLMQEIKPRQTAANEPPKSKPETSTTNDPYKEPLE